MQTRLSAKVIERLEGMFDGRIQYRTLKVLPFYAVLIKDVVILDDHPFTDGKHPAWAPVDTFFYARTIAATMTLKGLRESEGLHFHRVAIEDGGMHLVIEPDSLFPVNLTRIFNIRPKKESGAPTGNIFDISKIRARNFRYRMYSYTMPEDFYKGYGLNYADMDLTADLKGHGMRFSGGRMYGTCDRLSGHDKCGYRIHDFSGSCVVGMGKTIVRDLHLVDDWSDARARYYTMSYLGGFDAPRYTSKVLMELEMEPSVLAMKTIASFAGVLSDNDVVWDIRKGHARGYVNDLRVDGLEFSDRTSGVSGQADMSCIGLTTDRQIGLSYRLSNFRFTPASLSRFIACWSREAKIDLAGMLPADMFRLDASGGGSLDRLTLKAHIGCKDGSADADVEIRNLTQMNRGLEVSGTLGTDDLDISAFTGIKALGPCTVRTGIRAKLEDKVPSVIVDSLKICRLQALGYDYSGINAKGRFTGDKFDGRVVCSDPNLNFIFQGVFNLSRQTRNALYKFYANLAYADLKALNIDTRGGSSKASCQISANFMRVTRGDLLGDVNVRNLKLENDEGLHDIGDISIGSHTKNDLHRIQFSSSFADAGYVGSKAVGALVEDLQNITARRHLPALYKGVTHAGGSGSYDINVDIHDTRDLLSFVAPGAYVADSTAVRLKVDRDSNLSGSIRSARLAYGMNYLKRLDLTIDNYANSLNCIATADEVKAGGFGFRNSAITAYGEHDNFSLGFHYDGMTGVDNMGEIYLNGELLRDRRDSLIIKARPLSSYICFEDEQWNIGESDITLKSDGISISGFTLTCDDQKLAVDGAVSGSVPSKLDIAIDNFDLGIIGRFLSNDYGIGGRTSGRASIFTPIDDNMGITARLDCDSLSIGGVEAGAIRLSSRWDDDNNRLGLSLRNVSSNRDAILAEGYYSPADGRVGLDAVLDRFSAGLAKPFLPSLISSIDGSLSGAVRIDGPLDTLNISSRDLNINDISFKVGLTGVTYTVSGPLRMDNDGLFLNGLSIRDGRNGRGSLMGAIRYDRLKDMEMDLGVRLNGMQALAMSAEENKGVYGDLQISGHASVTGPFSKIQIDTDITTDGDGNVFVPISGGSTSANGSDLLTFSQAEEYKDPYDLMLQTIGSRDRKRSEFAAHARVSITPAVQAMVEMDGAIGNQVNVSGAGTVTIDIRPAGDVFTLNGDYSILSGSYRFEIPGVVSKDFTISSGSSVKFGGEIMDTELDIKAIHPLKTSLSTLTGDKNSVATRRNVECSISITDRLRNPHLAFDIDIPDLNPTMAAQVQGALNTEDKLQKQFMSLMLFGSFLPSESSGIVNGNNMILSNVSEIMTGQLNNILQKLDIPLDLGFGYQQNAGDTDMFDVAFSSQLFNNRVVVNGSVGNRKQSTSTSENGDIVGDIDIEYKIDNQGQFRVKLFSHSSDEYTSYLDLSQRNGVGITYQKEYNRFTDYLRNIFSSRKKRQQRELEEALAPQEDQTVIVIN